MLEICLAFFRTRTGPWRGPRLLVAFSKHHDDGNCSLGALLAQPKIEPQMLVVGSLQNMPRISLWCFYSALDSIPQWLQLITNTTGSTVRRISDIWGKMSHTWSRPSHTKAALVIANEARKGPVFACPKHWQLPHITEEKCSLCKLNTIAARNRFQLLFCRIHWTASTRRQRRKMMPLMQQNAIRKGITISCPGF